MNESVTENKKVSQVQRSINALEKQRQGLISRIEKRIDSCERRIARDNGLLKQLQEDLALLQG